MQSRVVSKLRKLSRAGNLTFAFLDCYKENVLPRWLGRFAYSLNMRFAMLRKQARFHLVGNANLNPLFGGIHHPC